MDTITICDLAVLFRVGVPELERAKPQRLLITVEMGCDFAATAQSDDLNKTIDYYAVSRRLLNFGKGRDWKLIEKLASDIAEMVLAEFGAQTAAVEIKKFILPETRYVAVRVFRQRKGADRSAQATD